MTLSAFNYTVAFIAKPTHSHHVGFPEKLFTRLNALLPEVVSGAIAKQLSVIKRYAFASQRLKTSMAGHGFKSNSLHDLL